VSETPNPRVSGRFDPAVVFYADIRDNGENKKNGRPCPSTTIKVTDLVLVVVSITDTTSVLPRRPPG